MTLPPFPATVIPASPEERLRLIQYGAECARAALPDGCVAVPRKPTEEMLNALEFFPDPADAFEVLIDEAQKAIDAARAEKEQRNTRPTGTTPVDSCEGT